MSEATKTKETTPEVKPETDIQAMNIFQRMSAITAELGTVAKNLSVKAGGGSYKAVSERDIIDAVKPLETKYRVYSYPSSREIVDDEILEGEKTYQGNTTKTTTFFTRIQTVYTFVNIDKPEETFSTIVFSEGIDPGDKGSGKAMTYADKYALMKAYKISTGDDPDQNASEENRYTRSGAGQSRNQYQPQNQGRNQYQPQGQQAPGPVYSCQRCNTPLRETRRTDGSMMLASDIAYYSIQRFGAVYCPECQRKEAAARDQK